MSDIRIAMGNLLYKEATPFVAVVATFAIGFNVLNQVYYEQPDNDRGKNYEIVNEGLEKQYEALTNKIDSVKNLKEQFGYISVKNPDEFNSMKNKISTLGSTIYKDKKNLISDIYNNSDLSEKDVLNYIKDLQSDGISDIADRFKDGDDIAETILLLKGKVSTSFNSLHDSHAFLRECKIEQGLKSNDVGDKQLNNIYKCMQLKDYNEFGLAQNPLSSLGVLMTYMLLIGASVRAKSTYENVLDKNSHIIENWAYSETKLLPKLKKVITRSISNKNISNKNTSFKNMVSKKRKY